MLQMKNINWLKVSIYATSLSISVVVVVAAFTYGLLQLGYDFSEDVAIFQLASYLCSFVINYIVYFTLSKNQLYSPFKHAVFVYIFNIAIGFMLEFLVPIVLITWEVFIAEQFVYISILVVATKHGIKYQNRKGFIDSAA